VLDSWHEHLCYRRTVAKRAIRPDDVVLPAPKAIGLFTIDLLNRDLLKRGGDLSVEKRITELPGEALRLSVLPRTARVHVARFAPTATSHSRTTPAVNPQT